MRTLIIDCSGFPLEHAAYITDETGHIYQTAHLPTAEIAGYANNSNVDKIYLQGPTDYCIGIQEEVQTELALEYANNNIRVEIL